MRTSASGATKKLSNVLRDEGVDSLNDLLKKKR